MGWFLLLWKWFGGSSAAQLEMAGQVLAAPHLAGELRGGGRIAGQLRAAPHLAGQVRH